MSECRHEGPCTSDDMQSNPDCAYSPVFECGCDCHEETSQSEPMADLGGHLYDWHQWLFASGIVDQKEQVSRVIIDIPMDDKVKVYVERYALVKGDFKPPPRIPADSPTVELQVHSPQEHTAGQAKNTFWGFGGG